MIKRKIYRYIGENGILDTDIFLKDVPHILKYRIIAEDGKLLTNGVLYVKSKDIFAIDLEDWYEIDDLFGQK